MTNAMRSVQPGDQPCTPTLRGNKNGSCCHCPPSCRGCQSWPSTGHPSIGYCCCCSGHRCRTKLKTRMSEISRIMTYKVSSGPSFH
ncbi:hypothetical protein Y1Q_0000104 [Alligator mississippiensis]|uniref:Uncharacterized protein n=1 Tax=Alligator mississippiensis TaxID=8496 RepID=A0A151NQH3_ALLMI|nr:hypothetical protein Y1Q_0000104 [Alligator mississippiensis]